MLKVQNITQDSLQSQSVVLADGTVINLVLNFKPMQDGWFMDLSYQKEESLFELKGCRICISPNILIQFSNLIPFGLACFSKESREPTQQQDFFSGNAELFILTEEEKEQYLEILSG